MKELKLSVDDIERIADNLVDKNNYMVNYEQFIQKIEGFQNQENKEYK